MPLVDSFLCVGRAWVRLTVWPGGRGFVFKAENRYFTGRVVYLRLGPVMLAAGWEA